MKLPNAQILQYEQIQRKVELYCLNSEHEYGKHKAYLFNRLLGITLSNADILIEAIYCASQNEDAEFVKTTPYCDVYDIIFEMSTSVGTAKVLTGWCVKHASGIPHLSTAYIL